MIKAIADAKQEALQATLNDRRKRDAAEHNDRIDSGATLRPLLFWENEAQTRIANVNLYTDLLTQAGDPTNSDGPFLTSEWYKRNIYIWSLIQKHTADTDHRIMVLFGAGHIAGLEQLIRFNPNWKIVELVEVMNKRP